MVRRLGSKETVKHGEVRESNALPGESPEKKKVRFLPEPGDGGPCAITVEELAEDYWSDKHGHGEMFEGLHCKVEPNLDVTNTEAALDRLLEKGVARDIPRDEGAGMKHLTTRWEQAWTKRNKKWEYKVRSVGREYGWQSSGKTSSPWELHTALDDLWTSSRSNDVCNNSHSGLHACLSSGS